MRRADRLFQIIQLIRRYNVTTAAVLAENLEVSERTVYRDIRDLVLSGVPIDGEAGVGYRLRKGFDLPPLMFSHTEVEALVLGSRLVMSWTDPALAKAAKSALGRIESALPEELRSRLNAPLFAPAARLPQAVVERMALLRAAIEERRKVRLAYRDVEGELTERTVRPLGLTFWGYVWSVTAWCELRDDFRSFRLDRAVDLQLQDERFVDEPGKTIEDFLRATEQEDGERPL